MRCFHGSAAALLAVLTIGAASLKADETPPKVIPASEAHKHVGEVVTVEMTVRSTGKNPKGTLLFLNSMEVYRSNDVLTLVFDSATIAVFKKAGIGNIETHYFRKVIYVTGKVTHFKSITEIEIESPDQIRVIGDAPETPNEAPGAAPIIEAVPSASPAPPGNAERSALSNPYVYGSIAVLGVGLLVLGVGLLVMFRNRKAAPPTPETTPELKPETKPASESP